jgi:mannose-1-phosphate guanylyltransferase
MPDSNHYACVLAGGTGERFWPMSRVRRPKHLLKLLSDRTLLGDTVRRLDGVVPRGNILILTSEAQAADVRAALPDLAPEQVVAEPARRDSGPAAALATAIVRARNPRAVLALLAADASIRDAARFGVQLRAALDRAEAEPELITFAVRPKTPSTGFGYLELAEELAHGPGGVFRRVARFVEKPDAATAQRYLDAGNYAWNASIFVWQASVFLAEAERHAPALGAFVRGFPAGDFGPYLAARFPGLPRISVDYAVMEKAARVATLLAEFDWDDVGTWTALPAHLAADPAGNTVRGPVALVDSANNIVVSNGRLITLCGVNDLVVVETPDAILVCHRDSVQALKKLQPLLPKEVL